MGHLSDLRRIYTCGVGIENLVLSEYDHGGIRLALHGLDYVRLTERVHGTRRATYRFRQEADLTVFRSRLIALKIWVCELPHRAAA